MIQEIGIDKPLHLVIIESSGLIKKWTVLRLDFVDNSLIILPQDLQFDGALFLSNILAYFLESLDPCVVFGESP